MLAAFSACGVELCYRIGATITAGLLLEWSCGIVPAATTQSKGCLSVRPGALDERSRSPPIGKGPGLEVFFHPLRKDPSAWSCTWS
jgi:hypothetical protein